MRTTDRMVFTGRVLYSLDEIVALGKTQGVGREDWLRAVVEAYDEDQPKFAVATNLLEFLGTITILKTEKFVARDCFMGNTKAAAPVKTSYLGSNFCSWFLGKTEKPSDETTLRYHTLLQTSVDGPIITELGSDKAEITLAQIYALMKEQKNGEAGVLLNNGCANIFYVRDVNRVLRAVRVRWYDDGWYVDAYSVGNPSRWVDGFRVFSRNS